MANIYPDPGVDSSDYSLNGGWTHPSGALNADGVDGSSLAQVSSGSTLGAAIVAALLPSTAYPIKITISDYIDNGGDQLRLRLLNGSFLNFNVNGNGDFTGTITTGVTTVGFIFTMTGTNLGDGLFFSVTAIEITGSSVFNQSCLGSSTPLSNLVRGAGLIRRAASSPIGIRLNQTGKLARGNTTPTKSFARAVALIRRGASTPTKTLVRSVALARRASSSPIASLVIGITRLLSLPAMATTAAAATRQTGKVAQAASTGDILGDEIVSNPQVTGGAGWTFTHCALDADRISFTNQSSSSASPTLLETLFKRIIYEVTFTISGLVSGTIIAEVGGNSGTFRNANGTFTERINMGPFDPVQTIRILGTATTTAFVDDVSVKRVGTATLLWSSGKIAQALTSPAATATRAAALLRLASASVVASLSRQAARILRVSSGPVATYTPTIGKTALAASTATTSIVRQAGKLARATSAPVASKGASAIVRLINAAASAVATRRFALSRTFSAFTAAEPSLTRSAGLPASASTAPVATRQLTPAKVLPGSSTVLASTVRSAGHGAQANTTPIRSLIKAIWMSRSVESAPSPSVIRSTGHSEHADAVAVGERRLAVGKPLTAATEPASRINRTFFIFRSGSAIASASLRRTIGLMRAIVIAIVPAMAKVWTSRTPFERATAASAETRIARASPESRLAVADPD